MTASRFDVIYETLLQALGTKGASQELAQALDDGLREWEQQRDASHDHPELAVKIAHRLFGHNAPDDVVSNTASILMPLGGSRLAEIIQEIDGYNALRKERGDAHRVFDALLKKPDVLYGIVKEMWERELYIAGPWEKDLVSYTRYNADIKVAAEVIPVEDGVWMWRVSVPNERKDHASGKSESMSQAAKLADEALSHFKVFVASPTLPTEEL